MTAPHTGNRTGNQQRISRPGNSQRIFLSSGKVIDQPPVLFRMPSVSPSAEPEEPAAEDMPPVQGAAPNVEEVPQVTKKGPRAPHFSLTGAGQRTGETQYLRTDMPTAGPAANSVPAGSMPQTEHLGEVPPVELADEPAETALPAPVVPLPSSPAPEREVRPGAVESSNRENEKPRGNDIPPVAPIPAGRSWMEAYGSRLIPVALIAAVAAYALLVNQGGQPSPETTLAETTLADLDMADETSDMVAGSSPSGDKPAARSAAPGGTGNAPGPMPIRAVQQPTSTADAVGTAGVAGGLSAPANATDNREFNSPIRQPANLQATNQSFAAPTRASDAVDESEHVVAAEPAFDLADLLAEQNGPETATQSGGPETSQSGPVNGPNRSFPADDAVQAPAAELTAEGAKPAWQRDLEAMGREMQAAGADVSGTATGDHVIRERTAEQGVTQDGRLVGSPERSSSAEAAAPIRENRWAVANREMPAQTTSQAHATPTGEPSFSVQPPAMTATTANRPVQGPEDAIQAAVDAAVGGAFGYGSETPVEAEGGAGYQATQQPAGVPDWTRYLPPPQSGSFARPNANPAMPGVGMPNGQSIPLTPSGPLNPPTGGAMPEHTFSGGNPGSYPAPAGYAPTGTYSQSSGGLPTYPGINPQTVPGAYGVTPNTNGGLPAGYVPASPAVGSMQPAAGYPSTGNYGSTPTTR